MLCAEIIVDGLHVSTHTDVRTYRDPVSPVDGSLLSGEEHVTVFLRILASGDRRIRSIDLMAIHTACTCQWLYGLGQRTQLE